MTPRGLLVALLLSLGVLTAADPPGGGEWKYDVIHRKKGDPIRGLVVEQTASTIKVRSITRKPGSATLWFTHVMSRAEVSRLELLSEADREQLRNRLEALKAERDLLTERLRALDPGGKAASPSADLLDLQPGVWPTDPKAKALSYSSAHFKLIAKTRPELAYLAAVQLEQVYDAFARALPPREAAAVRPTTILLTGSLAEYQDLAKAQKLNLFNPAFYDPGANQVVCGSDLEKLRDELEKVRAHHAAARVKLDERKADLVKAYKGAVPKELLVPLAEARVKIDGLEKSNDATFAQARGKLFQRLFHEAFHAYLGTFVYPAKDGPLPTWFNEGLAQIFETAIVEVGELRVGHADRERWEAMRLALARDTFLPLADLLRSGQRQFQVAHASDRQVSDRHYLAAWALAFYLTFEARLLGTPALTEYVAALKRGGDPLLAFRDLVGKPLPEFEKEFLRYLGHLQQDGTSKK